MELSEGWKKLEEKRLSKPVLGAVHIQKKSKHPVQKLKNSYLLTTGFTVLFLIFFTILFFYFHEPLVKGGLALVILCYIFFFVTNFSMYNKINVVLPIDQSLKIVLQHTYNFIIDNIRFQERVALFIYPIAGTAGFLMGGSVGNGDIENMMKDKIVIVVLIVVLAILTPLCFYLTRWMYKVSYGKCLKELKERIEELGKEG